MKCCLACNSQFPSSQNSCTACNYAPTQIDGFEAYSPALAQDGGGFKVSHFSELAALENTNFWFRARNEIIMWAMKKHIPKLQSFLEIGCGTGYVLAGVSKEFPSAQIWGSEIFAAGLPFAADRVPNGKLMQMDARRIPFHEEFDAIGAFDVLEHIEEDIEVLLQVKNALKSNGVLLLTVPQHQWLWSASDEYACHVRRYSAKEIHAKLASTGFEILRSTSFVSLLLPAMYAARAKKTNNESENDPTAEFKLPTLLNTFLYKTMRVEIAMIKAGINFPAGGSRLVVAKKVA